MTDADLTEFFAAQTSRGSKCSIPVAVAQMTPKQHAAFDKAMADERIQTTTIARVVNSWNVEVSDFAVGRHRRGQCKCPK